jgi:hypothetical protein
MAKRSDQHVRFYFEVIVSCLVPLGPRRNRDRVSDNVRETSSLRKLEGQIEAKFSTEGLDAAYRKHTLINSELRVYSVHFTVSTLHLFPAAQLFGRKGEDQFGVKAKFFLKEKLRLQNKIEKALSQDFVVNAISYEYAASRNFRFYDSMSATLKIKHIISKKSIHEADGRVREAIDNFNIEVSEFLKEHDWDVWSASTRSRPKNNVYEFELAAEIQRNCSEYEICGEVTLLEKNMTADQASHIQLDSGEPGPAATNAEAELRCILDLESEFQVEELTVNWVDCDEEVHEINDNLIEPF